MDIRDVFTFNGSDIGISVKDFVEWSLETAWDESNRGTLSEFIVKSSIESSAVPYNGRIMNMYCDGLSIATSAAAFIQSHDGNNLDRISFSCVPCRFRDTIPDVFVLCLFKATSRLDLPTELSNWTFFIVSGDRIRSLGSRSITLHSLVRMGPIEADYYAIHGAISLLSMEVLS